MTSNNTLNNSGTVVQVSADQSIQNHFDIGSVTNEPNQYSKVTSKLQTKTSQLPKYAPFNFGGEYIAHDKRKLKSPHRYDGMLGLKDLENNYGIVLDEKKNLLNKQA